MSHLGLCDEHSTATMCLVCDFRQLILQCANQISHPQIRLHLSLSRVNFHIPILLLLLLLLLLTSFGNYYSQNIILCRYNFNVYNYFLPLSSSSSLASSFLRFRDHTRGHTTVGRTPLDK